MAKKSGSRQSGSDGELRRTCGAMAAHMMLLERYPSFRQSQMRLEGMTDRRRQAPEDLAKAKIVTIKTVVNVVYNTDEQNVSDAQIASQIASLNKDFRATNPDRKKTPAPWKGLITDSRMEFKLVKVTRTRTSKASFTHDDGVKRGTSGGIAPYQPRTHLNFWVCPLGGGLLGYAQFPGGPLATDGVVINYRAFGTMGTAEPPFNRGRTATHEVGHYFNLRHIWGDTPDCSGSDLVADTPNCAGPNYGKADLPGRHLQQRSERRHVRQLHGLHRRRGDVHVHDAASAADAHGTAGGAARADVGERPQSRFLPGDRRRPARSEVDRDAVPTRTGMDAGSA